MDEVCPTATNNQHTWTVSDCACPLPLISCHLTPVVIPHTSHMPDPLQNCDTTRPFKTDMRPHLVAPKQRPWPPYIQTVIPPHTLPCRAHLYAVPQARRCHEHASVFGNTLSHLLSRPTCTYTHKQTVSGLSCCLPCLLHLTCQRTNRRMYAGRQCGNNCQRAQGLSPRGFEGPAEPR